MLGMALGAIGGGVTVWGLRVGEGGVGGATAAGQEGVAKMLNGRLGEREVRMMVENREGADGRHPKEAST